MICCRVIRLYEQEGENARASWTRRDGRISLPVYYRSFHFCLGKLAVRNRKRDTLNLNRRSRLAMKLQELSSKIQFNIIQDNHLLHPSLQLVGFNKNPLDIWLSFLDEISRPAAVCTQIAVIVFTRNIATLTDTVPQPDFWIMRSIRTEFHFERGMLVTIQPSTTNK